MNFIKINDKFIINTSHILSIHHEKMPDGIYHITVNFVISRIKPWNLTFENYDDYVEFLSKFNVSLNSFVKNASIDE